MTATGQRPPCDTMDLVTQRRAWAAGSVEETARQVADREEIRELTAIYAQRVAHGLSNADLFTDDGAYIQRRRGEPTLVEVRGRAEIDAHYVTRPDAVGSATPMIHNHVIEVTGDEARAICSIELRIAAPDGETFASGYYQDLLRRQRGTWLFVQRHVSFFRWGLASAP